MRLDGAELYELLHRGTRGDIAFYQRACGTAPRVLELGCGYGRVALALAQPGREVVAVDIDESLLARARDADRAGQVQWLMGDMRSLELGRHFDRVVIAYNTLCCLLSDADVFACLAVVRRHMSEDAQLLLDVYDSGHVDEDEPGENEPADDDPSDAEHDDSEHQPPGEPGESHIVAMEYRGELLDVFEQTDLDVSARRADTTYRFVSRVGDASLRRTIAQRYFRREDLHRLLSAAGLTVREIDDRETPQLFVVAEATGP